MSDDIRPYGLQSYWNERYQQQNSCYDWYADWQECKHQILSKLVPISDQKTLLGKPSSELNILIVGCGNSELSADMHRDGFRNITSMDYSEVVINKMKLMYSKSLPNLIFETQDVRKMTYNDSSFDVIIDKGTLDAILCGEGSQDNATEMLSEIYRILQPGGIFFDITYGDPSVRLNHFEHNRYKWIVEYESIAKTRILYTMKKSTK